MDRRTVFNGRLLPAILLLPQLLLTFFFFYLPAGQAVWSSMTAQDAFGQGSVYVGIDKFVDLFSAPLFLGSIVRTIMCCLAV
ncbi:MAG: sn-glycerol 3-phosphate transport system permease protein, partial [Acetobacteraceae bacterium]|nr:sn-glycerol 3-phosphate transport system permease protein [Acetobacteraceae bacterium]